MFNLNGKIAVVTGAAGGIGAATAGVLTALGAHVVVADYDIVRAESTAASIEGSTQGKFIDVSQSASIRELVSEITEQHGGLDIWVNNAGISELGLALDLTDDTWNRTLDINLTGSFYGAREAARYMSTHGGGSIINISSIAAFRGTKPEHHAAYDVSKAGVAHLAKVLAAEWATFGIRVNAVAPGYVNTDMVARAAKLNPTTMEQWLSKTAQNRLIEPSEIGQVIAFLSSPAAAAITGQTIYADAGYTIW